MHIKQFALKAKALIVLSLFFLPLTITAATPSKTATAFSYFVSPKGWQIAFGPQPSTHVLVGFYCPAQKAFTPSINFAIEEVDVDGKSYIQAVKNLYESDKTTAWRELGTIETQSGIAQISQLDTRNSYGDIRLLQSILVKNGKAFILTGASTKEDAPAFKEIFLAAFRSLHICKEPLLSVSDSNLKTSLEKDIAILTKHWKNYCIALLGLGFDYEPENFFFKKEFQKRYWAPFETTIKSKFEEKGLYWQILCLQKVQQDLLKTEVTHAQKGYIMARSITHTNGLSSSRRRGKLRTSRHRVGYGSQEQYMEKRGTVLRGDWPCYPRHRAGLE